MAENKIFLPEKSHFLLFHFVSTRQLDLAQTLVFGSMSTFFFRVGTVTWAIQNLLIARSCLFDFVINGAADSAVALRDGFSLVGGTNLHAGGYWSRSYDDLNPGIGLYRDLSNGSTVHTPSSTSCYVRACLSW